MLTNNILPFAQADFFFVPHYTACHLNVETFSEEQILIHSFLCSPIFAQEDSDALFQSGWDCMVPPGKFFMR